MDQNHTEQRKEDHLNLALQSQTQSDSLDRRFYYEPLLGRHPQLGEDWPFELAGKKMKFPIWVSSMTGGSNSAGPLNRILAKACQKHGLGMGLGSCRILLEDPKYLPDFDCRPLLGEDLPFFANLGIAQLERLAQDESWDKVDQLMELLDADGIFIHVNPMQEYYQEEGDRILFAPLETISAFVERTEYPVIVKEVGQGMGIHSLKALLQLPLEGIEFGAYGGTNFSKLEAMRRSQQGTEDYHSLMWVGHTAEEMTHMMNKLVAEIGNPHGQKLIISGGVRSFLEGYYLIQKSTLPAIYGQASPMLRAAAEGEEALDDFVRGQIEGLLMARQYLKVKQL